MQKNIRFLLTLVGILCIGGILWGYGDFWYAKNTEDHEKPLVSAVSRLKIACSEHISDHGMLDAQTLEKILSLVSAEDAKVIRAHLVVYKISSFGITIITRFDDRFIALFENGTVDVFTENRLQTYLEKHPDAKVYENRIKDGR